MTSRLIDAGGDFLVDASGDYLVWEIVAPGDTGSMTLEASAPTIRMYVDRTLVDSEAFELTDENGDPLLDENGDALRVVSLYAAPTISFTSSSPTITITTSED